MEEEFGTLRIYMYLDVPSARVESKLSIVRRILHTQHGVTKQGATDAYQCFMDNNDYQFRNKDPIHGVWQADPVYLKTK